jgi:hypothetical protein
VHASKEVVHTEVGHENREEGKGEVEVEPLGLLKHGETPAEERTKEEGETLEKVYNACRKIENNGWGYQVSERLVEYMESATPELQP